MPIRLPQSIIVLLACLAVPAGGAAAWDSPAPDVVLYCTPALQAPLADIAARFMDVSHVEVHILIGSPDGQAGLIRHRARADVLVAEAPVVAALKAEHLVRDETIVALGKDPFILIGKKGAAAAAGVTPAQLLAAHPIILTDDTTASSFDGTGVLRAAVPGTTPQRVIGVANTGEVIALVRNDAEMLGLVHATEAQNEGISTAATLPADPIAFSGTLLSNGQSRNAAALLAFIAGTQGRAILRRAGLEMTS